MANWEHVKRLKQGIIAWNSWRKQYPEVQPDLSELDRNTIEMEPLPNMTPEEVSKARLLFTYIDQTCLALATKRLLKEQDLGRTDDLLGTGEIQVVPQRTLWLHLEVPQPVYGVDPESDSAWAHERVAALFFRAQWSPETLAHAFVPPFSERPWTKDDPPAPTWWEWHLDLIDPSGIFYSAYHYYYDQRTTVWRKMEDATCPWDECGMTRDEAMGELVVAPCPECQEAMDYYSRWLATVIGENRGQPLFLENVEYTVRMRALKARVPLRGRPRGRFKRRKKSTFPK